VVLHRVHLSAHAWLPMRCETSKTPPNPLSSSPMIDAPRCCFPVFSTRAKAVAGDQKAAVH
jgi:hypothetical protein